MNGMGRLAAALGYLVLLAGACHQAQVPNLAPEVGTPSGPVVGEVDSMYEFTVSATDPEESRVACRFSWGDGDTSSWSNQVESGSDASMSHVWVWGDTFEVRAQARDEGGVLSGWSDATAVVIAGYPPFPLVPVDSLSMPLRAYASVLAVDAGGDHVYVAGGSQVAVMSVAVRWWVGVLDLGSWGGVAAMCVSPDGEYLYVHTLGPQWESYVVAVRTSDRIVTSAIRIQDRGAWRSGIGITPDGSKLYVTADPDIVYVIRTADTTVARIVEVGNDPYGLAVAQDGRLVYVCCHEDGHVRAIDTENDSVVAELAVGGAPMDLVLSPDGSKLYVAGESRMMYVVDTERFAVVDSALTPGGAWAIDVMPNGLYAYLGGGDDHTTVMRLADGVVVAMLPMYTDGYDVACLPGSEEVYVVGEGIIYVLELPE